MISNCSINLLQLCQKEYYKFHSTKYYITPDKNSGLFHIKCITEYEIINKQENEIPLRFKMKLYFTKKGMSHEEIKDAFVFNEMKVNGKDIKDYKDKMEITDTNEKFDAYYDYKMKLVLKLGYEKVYRVKLDYEFDVPINDRTQSYKISLPCKNLEHEINILEDKETGQKWEVNATAFASFYVKQGDYSSTFKVKQSRDDSATVLFNDWTIPGAGYVMSYREKN